MAVGTFPTSVSAYVITSGGETPNSASGGLGLSGLLNAFETDITALSTKMGTGASTPTNNAVLTGSGVGTSAWSTTLAGLTLTTPTIASFTNATHNHTNAAGGGKITSAGITSFDTSLTTVSNPYKFSAYRTTAHTSSTSLTKISFDTELYDTNNNFDIVTNVGRYTAPVAGFYHFTAAAGNTAATTVQNVISLKKNATTILKTAQVMIGATNTGSIICISGDVQLAANDFVEVMFLGGSGSAMAATQDGCFFDGYLISQT